MKSHTRTAGEWLKLLNRALIHNHWGTDGYNAIDETMQRISIYTAYKRIKSLPDDIQ